MKPINYHAKAEHYADMASRAAFAGACATSPADRDAWEERAARYDALAAEYRMAARKAA